MVEQPQQVTILRNVAWAVLLLSIVLAGYASYHRVPWSDEGYFSSAAYDLAVNNTLGTPVLSPTGNGISLPRIQEFTYWVLPGYLVGQGLWFKMFPHTLLWTRLFTVAWLPLLFVSVFVYTRNLFPDARVRWLALILLAGNFIIIDNAGFARPDIPTCALGLAGMAVYTQWREQNIAWAMFGANLCLALSGLMHPNGIYHWVGLIALILILDRQRLNLKLVLIAAVPYAILGSAYFAYLVQDFQAAQGQLSNNNNGRFPTTANPFTILGNELYRYAQAYGLVTGGINSLKIFQLLVHWSAVIGCLAIRPLRSQPMVRLLLIQVGLYFIGLMLFNQKLSYYLVHIMPFYAIVSSIFLLWIWDRLPRLRLAVALVVVGVLALDMGGIVLKANTRSYIAEQRRLVDYLRANAGPGDRIFGSASLLYEMGFDSRLTDDAYLGVDSGQVPDIVVVEQLYRSLYEAWAQSKPEDMARIRERLEDGYELAYQTDSYEVWLRKPDARKPYPSAAQK